MVSLTLEKLVRLLFVPSSSTFFQSSRAADEPAFLSYQEEKESSQEFWDPR